MERFHLYLILCVYEKFQQLKADLSQMDFYSNSRKKKKKKKEKNQIPYIQPNQTLYIF